MLPLFLLLPPSAAADGCQDATRAVVDLQLALALATDVAGAWPGWEPSLGEVHYATAEGIELIVNGGVADCPTLGLPIKLGKRRKPATDPEAHVVPRGSDFLVELADGTDPWAREDWMGVVVHELFHVHQLQRGFPYKEARPKNSQHSAAWAYQVPGVRDDVARIVTLGRRIAEEGFTLEAAAGLMSARQRHVVTLGSYHPRLPAAIEAQERYEGLAVYVENQLPVVPAARERLLAAGVATDAMEPALWREAAWAVSPNYTRTTGYLMAMVLDASGISWKDQVHEKGFDKLLQSAINRASRQR